MARGNGHVIASQTSPDAIPVVRNEPGGITEEALLEKAREALFKVLEKGIEMPQMMGAIVADVGKIVFDRANQIGSGGGSYESRVKRRT